MTSRRARTAGARRGHRSWRARRQRDGAAPLRRSARPVAFDRRSPNADVRRPVHVRAACVTARRPAITIAALPSWSHDYLVPRRQRPSNFMKIMNEVSYLGAAHRGQRRPRARRPGAVQVPGRLHDRAGLLEMTDAEAAALPRVSAEGRLRDLRRLPRRFRRAAAAGTTSTATCSACCPSARFVDLDAVASDLPLVLRNRLVRHHSAVLRSRPPGASAASSRTTTRRSG